MSRFLRSIVVFVVSVVSLLPAPAAASPLALPVCVPGSQPSGAIYVICVPGAPIPWNGDLVVFAHGYVDPQKPVGIPEDQLTLPDGTSLPGLVTSLGFAFAVSSYSKNGLAVTQGVADTAELVAIFKAAQPATRNVFVVGVSEGGLIATLSVEKFPNVYAGGVSACGPVGDFRGQINYFGDFRALFDYFYPNVLPGTATSIPAVLHDNWYTNYGPLVAATVTSPANLRKTEQLLRTSNAPIDPANLSSVVTTVVGLLDYNVRGTEDAKTTLNGQPFSNKLKWYFGSDNDWKLNWGVTRYSADKPALAQIAASYQTSGKLSRPIVGLHNVGDPIVPFWHELVYRAKTIAAGNPLKFVNIPVNRYGHCNFNATEALAAFGLLVYQVEGTLPANIQAALPSKADQAEFYRLVKESGVK